MKPFGVRELIIEVQQQVQRLGAYRRDQLAEPNILWRLNTAQDRFIKKRIKPNPSNPNQFMVDEKSRADIQTLITPDYSVRTIFDRKNQAYGYLPYNFEYLVADRSIILEDCEEEFETPRADTTFQLYAITFPDSDLGAPNYFKAITITVGILPTLYNLTGVVNKKEKFELVEYVIQKLDELGAAQTVPWKTYWEKFKNYYFPDQFIIVGQAGIPQVVITSDTTVGASTPKTYTESLFSIYAGDAVANRGIKNDFVRDIYNNYYDQPTPDSPVTSLADNRIFVHTTERFLVPEILIDYIRKPRRISLSLNQTSELPGHTHEEICSLAAEIILGNVEASNYDNKIRENTTRLQ